MTGTGYFSELADSAGFLTLKISNANKMKNSNYILIVDDNKYDQDLFQRVLDELNVENRIVFKQDGKEALNYLKSHEEIPFMIISDINMPRMNGLEFLKELQQDERLKGKSVPFIFLTSSDQPSEILNAYKINVNGYFIKSWDIDALKKTIKLILDYWDRSELPAVEKNRKNGR